MRKMSIGENYVGKLTLMRSNISRFSRGTSGACQLTSWVPWVHDGHLCICEVADVS